MFGSTKGANAYAKIGVETGVLAASPHKLIVMLFDGALVALTNALGFMQAGNIPKKGHSISHAITIIDSGLRASLDKKVGGEVATNLDALYAYMSNRLITANLQNSQDMVNEVIALLKDLKESWEAIDPARAMGAEAAMPAMPPKADALAPQLNRLVKA